MDNALSMRGLRAAKAWTPTDSSELQGRRDQSPRLYSRFQTFSLVISITRLKDRDRRGETLCHFLRQVLAKSAVEKLGAVLGGEGSGFGFERGLSGFVEIRWRRGAGGDRNADGLEKVFGTRRGAEAEHPRGFVRDVAKGVRRVGGDVGGLARPHDGLFTAKGDFDLALQDGEHLFEIMTMGRRSAAGWDHHVDEAVAPGGIFAGEEDGVGVACQGNVRQGLIFIRPRKREAAAKVIGWQWGWVRRHGVGKFNFGASESRRLAWWRRLLRVERGRYES